MKVRRRGTFAPGQEDDFLVLINDSSDDITLFDDIPKDVQEMVKLYSNSDSMSKIVIVTLFDHDKYTKEETVYFGCSRYKVDQAKKWRKSCKGLLLSQKVKHNRKKPVTIFTRRYSIISILMSSELLSIPLFLEMRQHSMDFSSEVITTMLIGVVHLFEDLQYLKSFLTNSNYSLV